MSRVLFITPKQPSTNPRMRKAADALAAAGHEVHVLYAYNADWATVADEEILKQPAWTHERIGGDPREEPVSYHLGRFQRKLSAALGRLESSYCPSLSSFIRAGLKWQPELVIGHNPGALFPIHEIARRLQVPSLFDAEDYHRGESKSDTINASVAQLEDRWLSEMTAVTTAAPLITQAYQTLYPEQEFVTVNNAFPLLYSAVEALPQEGPLRLVWFSQVVGQDRGLEPFLEGMALLKDAPCELTIIGMCPPEIKAEMRAKMNATPHVLHFKDPMGEADLFAFLSTQEIGLALELGETLNRQYCRTNKLYAYPLSGCLMLASNTPAQVQFLEEHPDLGHLIDLGDKASLTHRLQTLFSDRHATLAARGTSLQKAKSRLNWDYESLTLLEFIDRLV